MGRLGKIARLPQKLREEVNRRLENNEPAGSLLGWLNGLSTVKKLLAREFDGAEISEPNLSAWRTGGFRAWQREQETLARVQALSAEAGNLKTAVTKGALTDHLATMVAARFACVLADWDGEVPEELDRTLKALHRLGRTVTVLRRADQREAWLRMQQERWERKKGAEDAEKAEKGPPDWQLTPEERQRRIREIYGLPPEGPCFRSPVEREDEDHESRMEDETAKDPCEQPPEDEPQASECGMPAENADERAKNELMGRDQVARNPTKFINLLT